MYLHFCGHVQFCTPFSEEKFCSVPSCVFDKLGCAAGEKSLRNTSVYDQVCVCECARSHGLYFRALFFILTVLCSILIQENNHLIVLYLYLLAAF
jgi:hypothetical protein